MISNIEAAAGSKLDGHGGFAYSGLIRMAKNRKAAAATKTAEEAAAAKASAANDAAKAVQVEQ